jgi:hypothetical protein
VSGGDNSLEKRVCPPLSLSDLSEVLRDSGRFSWGRSAAEWDGGEGRVLRWELWSPPLTSTGGQCNLKDPPKGSASHRPAGGSWA